MFTCKDTLFYTNFQAFYTLFYTNFRADCTLFHTNFQATITLFYTNNGNVRRTFSLVTLATSSGATP